MLVMTESGESTQGFISILSIFVHIFKTAIKCLKMSNMSKDLISDSQKKKSITFYILIFVCKNLNMATIRDRGFQVLFEQL